MIKGLRDLEKSVEKFKRTASGSVAGSAERQLRRRVMPAMQRKIIDSDAVASTELFHSFTVETFGGGMAGDRFIHLRNYAPHAPYVEFGTGGFHRPNPYTRAFTAPPMSPHLVAEIRQWIYVKPTFVLRENMTPESTAQAIATAIAFGAPEIGRPPGTPAQPFFFNTWFEHELRVRKRLRRTFSRKVQREFGH